MPAAGDHQGAEGPDHFAKSDIATDLTPAAVVANALTSRPVGVWWLYAAMFVTVVRFFQPAPIGYDPGLQIQAAQNLLAGRGLAVYQSGEANLAAPGFLVTLTHFPAGYSLAVAALIACGLGLSLIVKLLGAAGTVFGWWGWSRLTSPFFAGAGRSAGWKWVAITVAALTPLLFTPPWGGTDIFLWAAVPWVLYLVVAASHDSRGHHVRLDVAAGFLCGLAFLMRYAAVFLVAYTGCVIVWQCGRRISAMARRLAAFGAGVLPFVAFQGAVNYFVSTRVATPGGVSLDTTAGAAVQRLTEGIQLLHFANYAWAFWLPGKVQALLLPAMAGARPWQLAMTLVSLVALVAGLRSLGIRWTDARYDARVVACGIFLAVPFTLLVAMTFGSYAYVSDLRYYMPTVPLGVGFIFAVATADHERRHRLSDRVVPGVAGLYVTGYAAMVVVYVVFMFVPGRIGTTERERLLGSQLQRWPSLTLADELSTARRFAITLANEEPDTLLVTARGAWFYWDPAVDRSRLRELSCDALRASSVSGPSRLVIVSFDKGAPEDLWYYDGNAESGRFFRADCFERLPHREIRQRFPEEGIKVLEARVDAGQQVILRP